MRKFRVLGVAVAACLAVAAQGLAATAIDASFFRNSPPANNFSAENREYLVDRSFATDHVKGRIDVGDSFLGMFNVTLLNASGANVGGNTGVNELTGVFEVMVAAKIPLGGPLFQYVFVPDPTFVVPGSGNPSGMVAALFTGTPNYAEDFNDPSPAVVPAVCDDGTACPPRTVVPPSSADVSVGPYATETAFLATAMDGTPFLTLGFAGLSGEGMSCISAFGDNILPFFGIPKGTGSVFCNLNLNRLVTGAGFPSTVQITRTQPSIFAPGTFVDFAISEFLGGVFGLDTPFEVSSNLNGSFDTRVVPEPTTLLLFGGGLLGLAILVHRRKKA